MSSEQLEKYVLFLKPNETKLKQVSKQGLLYFKSVYGVIDEPITETQTAKKEDEVIEILKEQLRIKDAQIATLMEQNRNYQILLQGQQVLSLSEKKKPFFKRLFNRSSEQE